jgi:serine beta-lactamase-like protein LACTB, mitochondrial
VPKHRKETWLAVIVLGVALIPAAILGLWGFMSVTAPTLHPDAQEVPSRETQAPPPKWTGTVAEGRQIVRAALVEENLPGLSVAVAAGGELVWAEAFGWADLENKVPLTPDTRLRIGTASKVFTSAAVGLLVEDGRLTLDDEIQTYVPEYPQKQWPVTVRQLMANTAGIRNDGGDEENLSERCERTVNGLRRFADEPLRFEPGTQYRYSNYGWILVSAAVERAADEPFFSFVKKRVFEPLGLDDTMADSPTEPALGRATDYFPRFAADPNYGPQDPSNLDLSCFAGAAAFYSTPSDLVRFTLAFEAGKLVRPETVRLLQAPQRLASGKETGYGLGWDLETIDLLGTPARVVGHDGEVAGGPVVSLMLLPEHDLVVAAASNTAYAETFPLASKIAAIFAGHGATATDR